MFERGDFGPVLERRHGPLGNVTYRRFNGWGNSEIELKRDPQGRGWFVKYLRLPIHLGPPPAPPRKILARTHPRPDPVTAVRQWPTDDELAAMPAHILGVFIPWQHGGDGVLRMRFGGM